MSVSQTKLDYGMQNNIEYMGSYHRRDNWYFIFQLYLDNRLNREKNVRLAKFRVMSKPMLVALGLTIRIHSATDWYPQLFPPDIDG